MSAETIQKEKPVAADNSGIQLCLIKAEKYNEGLQEILKNAAGGNTHIIYVSVNKPCTSIGALLQKFNIPDERSIIIDLASKPGAEKKRNCVHLASQKNLTELSLAISQSIYNFEGKEILLIFDSLSTLLIFNDKNVVLRFIHFIVNKLRSNNVSARLFSLDSADDVAFSDKVAPVVDEVKRY